jgi:cytochrome c biogenesis protein CcdA
VAVAAVVALAAWLLLLLVKGVVVLAMYALGALLVVVPLLTARRLVGRRTGSERWRRIGAIAAAVAVGVLLCVVAHLVSRHGWLLVALPLGALVASRGLSAVRRPPR